MYSKKNNSPLKYKKTKTDFSFSAVRSSPTENSANFRSGMLGITKQQPGEAHILWNKFNY